MREVKFRAFWKGVNKFRYFDSPTLVCSESDKGTYGIFFPSTDGSVFMGETSPELFIGKKDKNGKEVYEGDIIKWYYLDYEEPNITEVKYVDNSASFSIPIDVDFEVIGNVHQNPELL